MQRAEVDVVTCFIKDKVEGFIDIEVYTDDGSRKDKVIGFIENDCRYQRNMTSVNKNQKPMGGIW